jgi:hypothetical protein
MPEDLLAPARLETLVVLAGVGQLLLVAASPAIPIVLGWRAELARCRPLTREVFWTWATYVWLTHLSFGLVSTFGARLLVERTPLARLVCGFIGTWWGARLVIQFTYFDRTAAPPGGIYRVGEAALVLLFVALTAVYWTVALSGRGGPR